MKILSTISFIVLIVLVCLTQTTLSLNCLEYLSPFDRNETRVVECKMVTTNDKRQTSPTTDNMFIIDFHCLINDQVLCKKVENVFITAGKFITATINLKSPVIVNATFTNLCVTRGGCTATSIVLGAAGPARMVPQQDDDGKMRLYPQALHKQLNLPQHPEYVSNDIIAEFNSDMTYWFEGDPLPMLETQADMLYIVLHELIHGLGFINSWNDYFDIQILTPFIAPKITPTEGGTGQFYEFIFDKYLVLLQNGTQVTSLTDELNKFPINIDGTIDEFVNSFMASPQYSIAQNMLIQGTTRNAIGFQIQNDFVILETSLTPFRSSSSIGHVDLETYLNSSDFLMMYTYPKATLSDMMARAGSTNTTGPIGPKLRILLGFIGYEIKPDYIPPVAL